MLMAVKITKQSAASNKEVSCLVFTKLLGSSYKDRKLADKAIHAANLEQKFSIPVFLLYFF